MSLDGTYSGFKTTLTDFLHRAGIASTAIDDWIVLAEDYFNSVLRVPAMEARATATATQFLALPTDFLEVRNIRLNTSPATSMEYITPQVADVLYASTSTRQPAAYTIVADQFEFFPAPDGTYTVEIDYYAKVPPLATNAANWLLTRYPRAYLYACMTEALVWAYDDQRAASATNLRNSICQAINTEGKNRNISGPLYIRPLAQAR